MPPLALCARAGDEPATGGAVHFCISRSAATISPPRPMFVNVDFEEWRGYIDETSRPFIGAGQLAEQAVGSQPPARNEHHDRGHVVAVSRSRRPAVTKRKRRRRKDGADRGVATYVETNIERFIAMDKAGKLDAYIENCPQLDEN
jgi:hypothetical protein